MVIGDTSHRERAGRVGVVMVMHDDDVVEGGRWKWQWCCVAAGGCGQRTGCKGGGGGKRERVTDRP